MFVLFPPAPPSLRYSLVQPTVKCQTCEKVKMEWNLWKPFYMPGALPGRQGGVWRLTRTGQSPCLPGVYNLASQAHKPPNAATCEKEPFKTKARTRALGIWTEQGGRTQEESCDSCGQPGRLRRGHVTSGNGQDFEKQRRDRSRLLQRK